MDPASALTTVRIVGGTTALCAALGVVATLATVRNVLSGKADDIAGTAPFFRRAFFLFSALSIAFNLMLGLIAAALIKGYSISWWQFLAVFVPPVLYVAFLGVLWRNSSLGPSVAAATGCGNVGLAIPFFFLLPVWGPVALWVAA